MTGELAIGTWIHTLSSTESAARFAAQGFDFVYIDMQHSGFSESTIQDLALGVRLGGALPVVRPPSKSYPLGRLMKLGAGGVLMPDMSTAAEVEDVVGQVKEHPVGHRAARAESIIPVLSMGGREAPAPLGLHEVVAIQIESAEGVENLSELLRVPGLDVAVVGRSDLSYALGVPGETRHPRVEEAVLSVIRQCQDAGVIPGLLVSDVEEAQVWIDRGIRWVPVGSDIRALSEFGRRVTGALSGK
jgi:4-hydroxy-2-oxoheptanedioate aldolase